MRFKSFEKSYFITEDASRAEYQIITMRRLFLLREFCLSFVLEVAFDDVQKLVFDDFVKRVIWLLANQYHVVEP